MDHPNWAATMLLRATLILYFLLLGLIPKVIINDLWYKLPGKLIQATGGLQPNRSRTRLVVRRFLDILGALITL